METWQVALSSVLGGGAVAAILTFVHRYRTTAPDIAEKWDRLQAHRFDQIRTDLTAEIERRDERLARMEADLASALEAGAADRKHRLECEERLSRVRSDLDALYKEIKEAMRGASVWADENGIILDAEAEIMTLFHFTRDELIGKPIATIIHPDLRIKHEDAYKSFVSETREPRQWAVRSVGRKGTGESIPVEIQVLGSWARGDNGRVVHARICEAYETFRR
jgi:PAS domain S-box-containing protein